MNDFAEWDSLNESESDTLVYNQGYGAGYNGFEADLNPYTCEYREFEIWDDGFMDGQVERTIVCNKGYLAFMNKQKTSTNPYNPDSVEFGFWLDGYVAAAENFHNTNTNCNSGSEGLEVCQELQCGPASPN